jgi:hypothetical protein
MLTSAMAIHVFYSTLKYQLHQLEIVFVERPHPGCSQDFPREERWQSLKQIHLYLNKIPMPATKDRTST